MYHNFPFDGRSFFQAGKICPGEALAAKALAAAGASLRFHFRGALPAQNFSGIVIDPRLRFRYFFLRNLAKIGPFGEESPEHPIIVFVAAFLPGRIAVAIVYLKPFPSENGCLQLLKLHKFRTVIRRNALELLPKPFFSELPLKPVKYSPDRCRALIRYFEAPRAPGYSVHHGQYRCLGLGLPDNQINFLVSALRPVVDFLRTVGDAG